MKVAIFSRVLSLSAVFCAFAALSDEAQFISENAGNTVDNAADYLLSENWKDSVVGDASGRNVSFQSRDTTGFVKLNSDVTVSSLSGFYKLVLFGDGKMTVSKINAEYARLQNFSLYTDIVIPSGVNAESYDYIVFCGDMTVGGYMRFIGNTLFRGDLYANSSETVRRSPWKVSDLNMSGNYVWYFAPRGSGEVRGIWRQVKGSAYLFPVGANAFLAPGAAVSGEGIASDTFLKRIFPDGSIELSKPVTSTHAENEVVFAAFDPVFEQVHKTWRCTGTNGRVGLVKYREKDEARLVFSAYAGASSRGITMPSDVAGAYPGTVVLSNAYNYTYPLKLGRCRVELPAAESGVAGLPNVSSVSQYGTDSESVIVVPDGVSAVVNNFTNLVGVLVKEGAGELTLDLKNETKRNTGTLTLREGTLRVSCGDEGSYVKNLKLGARTVFRLNGGVFTCDGLVAESGAVFEGPGTLVLSGLPRPVEGLTVINGAKVAFKGVKRDDFVYTVPEPEVAGSPALWLDVSTGVTTDPTGEYVLRWNDVRGEGYDFVTNRNESVKPRLVKNSRGEPVSVYLPLNEASVNVDDQAILMWSRPLGNIRAVFIVKGAYMGGGQLLGGISNSMWMRPAATKFDAPLLYGENLSKLPALSGGRFYINGSRRSVDNGYAYPGGVTNATAMADWMPQLAEFITAGNAYADNFAFNAGAGRSGRQLIHAAIIYTNELTEVQRLSTERYLIDRYGLVDVHVVDPSSLPGSVGALDVSGDDVDLSIADGGIVAVESVSGSGALEKSGPGEVFVKDLVAPDADVVVSEGVFIVRSYANDGTDLPGVPALHVDASLVSSIATNSAGKITKWVDVRGESVNVATNIPSCWGSPVVEENAVGARPAVSFGARGSYGTYKNSSPALRFNNLEARAFFHVMASVDGAGVLLGCCDDVVYKTGERFYGIHRANFSSGYTYAYNATYRRPNWETRDYDHTLICSNPGATVFRQNGVDMDISGAKPSSDWQLIACATPEPINTSGFAQIKVSDTSYVYGGMKVGESLIYTNKLSRGSVLQIEAYLNRKWFNVQTPCYRPAQVKSLTVESGACVEFDGSAPITVGSFASSGSVAGSVVVEGGSLSVAVSADGVPAPLGVTGKLTLKGDGIVYLTGAAGVVPGLWPIADNVELTGKWVVKNADGTDPRLTSIVIVEAGKMYLKVSPNGIIMLVR
jgi:hypothetical protein